MRRFLAVALPVLAMLAVLYAIGSSGSERHTKSTTPSLLPPAQPAATTAAQGQARTSTQASTPTPRTTTASETTTVITAKRTDCRWRQYDDGGIGTDPDCAPGALSPGVAGNIGQTVCDRAWVAAASKLQPPPTTLDRLLIEYQLPGNPVTYALARVIPVADGGSPTSPQNLYPLPLNGYGGQQTRTLVANQLHDEICSHKITVVQAAKMLEGDWLSRGFPNDD